MASMTAARAAVANGGATPARRPSVRPRIAWLIGRRVLVAIPICVAISIGVFLLAAWSPFDPLVAYAGSSYEHLTAAQQDSMRSALGFTIPWWEAWGHWASGVLHGDLGFSRGFAQPVTQVIVERLPWTLLLSTLGLALGCALGAALGALAGLRQGSLLDRACSGLAMLVQGVPPYVISLAFVSLFAITWRLLPTGGLTDSSGTMTVGSVTRHLVLPVTVMGVSQLPWFVLSVRDSIGAAMRSDPVRGAMMRGLSTRTIIRKHVLPVSLAPLATLVGARLPELVVGAVLVEEVFGWPGLAAAMVTSAEQLDLALLAALTLMSTLVVLLGSMIADCLYLVLDPRVTDD